MEAELPAQEAAARAAAREVVEAIERERLQEEERKLAAQREVQVLVHMVY